MFEEDYGLHLVEVRITNIVDDIMSSSFSAANFRATYARWFRVSEMIFKRKYLISMPLNLGLDPPSTRVLGITYLDILCNHISCDVDVVLMIQAADVILTNDQEPAQCAQLLSSDTQSHLSMNFTIATQSKIKIEFWRFWWFSKRIFSKQKSAALFYLFSSVQWFLWTTTQGKEEQEGDED